jgi:lia operon protein LiaG
MSKRMRNFLIILASVTVGSFMIAAALFYFTGGIRPVSAVSTEISESAQFGIEDISRIEVATVSTNVRVLPSSDEEVHVYFTGHTTTGMGTAIPRMETDIEDGVLSIQIVYPSPIVIGLFHLSSLELDVYIPSGYERDLDVQTTSGAIQLEEMTLENIKTNSVSGRIDLESIYAKKISVNNTSGSVVLEDTKADMNINTVSGKIDADLQKLEKELVINSISGAVKVTVPRQSSFAFALSSTSGKIENDFEANIASSSNRELKGTVGDGNATVSIKTVSGRIMLGHGQ